jgi:3-oxoacyl-[acyl-carrier protein] reductase
MRLDGRIAFVTGSSRGIGAAIARRLAADGAKIILHARAMSPKIEAVAEEIRAGGGTADIVLGDLRTAEEPIRVVREAFDVHKALDILVCNAGGGGGGPVIGLYPKNIAPVLSLNLRSVILSVAEFARLTRSPHGRVVLISSAAGTHPAFGSSVYAAAKAGAEAFCRSAAQELGERGITLNSIAPGMTLTDMVKDPRVAERVAPWMALRRVGQPEDIADVAAFLASDEARWLTGLTLMANGGAVTTAATILAYTRPKG